MNESNQTPELNFAGADLAGADFFKAELAGAKFTGADLRGANFAYADLRGANFTKARLGPSPSSYIGRVEELYGALAVASVEDLTYVHDLASSLAEDLIRSHDSSVSAAHEVAFSHALKIAADLADDLGSSHDVSACLALVSDLNRSLARALGFACALPAALDCDRDRADSEAFANIHGLISSLGGGAIFYGADLTGAILMGADVAGAIMTGSVGLESPETLTRKGAIFNDRGLPLY